MLGDSIVVSATEPTGNNRRKVWFRKGKNLFDKNTSIITGYYLDDKGSLVSSENSWYQNVFIEVNSKIQYTISSTVAVLRICFYDKDEKFISRATTEGTNITFFTPENCKYVRLSGNNADTQVQRLQLEQNSTATSYEAYVESQIFIKNSNEIYEEFINNNNIKELTFTKNEANNIFYYSVYATENEVQISADIRYNFVKNTKIKVLTIEKGYEALISNVDKTLRFPISTDSEVGITGYADVNTKGEVYLTTLGAAKAAFINIRYRYK